MEAETSLPCFCQHRKFISAVVSFNEWRKNLLPCQKNISPSTVLLRKKLWHILFIHSKLYTESDKSKSTQTALMFFFKLLDFIKFYSLMIIVFITHPILKQVRQIFIFWIYFILFFSTYIFCLFSPILSSLFKYSVK